MKILIYGAGVIGSIYAAKLFEAKNDVTLSARGKRYESLLQNGVIIKEQLTGKKITVHIPLVQQLAINDSYDLIIVTVRLDQLKNVMTDLKNNAGSSLVMLMLNNPENLKILSDELKPKYLLFGFPGVGGIMNNEEIDFVQIKQQKTTIGDINQVKSPLLETIKSLFENAGFATTISNNMDAWLKTHAIFIACICATIIKENGDSIQLGRNKKSVQTMIKSIKEGFKAMKNLGIPITPFNLKMIFLIMPSGFLLHTGKKQCKAKWALWQLRLTPMRLKKKCNYLRKKFWKSFIHLLLPRLN